MRSEYFVESLRDDGWNCEQLYFRKSDAMDLARWLRDTDHCQTRIVDRNNEVMVKFL